jgi:hypothetical protein
MHEQMNVGVSRLMSLDYEAEPQTGRVLAATLKP